MRALQERARGVSSCRWASCDASASKGIFSFLKDCCWLACRTSATALASAVLTFSDSECDRKATTRFFTRSTGMFSLLAFNASSISLFMVSIRRISAACFDFSPATSSPMPEISACFRSHSTASLASASSHSSKRCLREGEAIRLEPDKVLTILELL